MQNIECDSAKYLFKAIDDTNIDNVSNMSDEQIESLATLGMLQEISELKEQNRQLAEDAELFKEQFNDLEVEFFDIKEKYENLLKYAPSNYRFRPIQDEHDCDEYHVISVLNENFKDYEDIIYIKASTTDIPIWQTYELANQIFNALRNGDISGFKEATYNDSIYKEYDDYYDEYW